MMMMVTMMTMMTMRPGNKEFLRNSKCGAPPPEFLRILWTPQAFLIITGARPHRGQAIIIIIMGTWGVLGGAGGCWGVQGGPGGALGSALGKISAGRPGAPTST